MRRALLVTAVLGLVGLTGGCSSSARPTAVVTPSSTTSSVAPATTQPTVATTARPSTTTTTVASSGDPALDQLGGDIAAFTDESNGLDNAAAAAAQEGKK